MFPSVSAGLRSSKAVTLYLLNLMCFISSICTLWITIAVCLKFYYRRSFITLNLLESSSLLFILGLCVLLLTIHGLFGILKPNRFYLIFLATVFTVIMIVEFLLAGSVYEIKSEDLNKVYSRMNLTMSEYNQLDRSSITESWNELQKDLKCCGTTGPSSWSSFMENNYLPVACCYDNDQMDSCSVNSNVYESGCLDKLKTEILSYSNELLWNCILFASLQLLFILLVCYWRFPIETSEYTSL
ncbi:tetraspanin-9-like [Adelges cooleyi]|uniref:tetraspanin-9-like n=1 Tax=Adelges cooleyi TaxID=133065 RepID=UPI0021800C48|nr:tetraspanin-9-like [Adelges cooleyi]XP_050423865.1 tetraspanin-9-like [Adelges cooleyi]